MDAATPAPWRQLLPQLDGLPLLPIGPGSEGKAPADPLTGENLSGWPTKAFTPQQVAEACPKITAVGFRPGPDAGGLIAFDIDGASAVALLRDYDCDPLMAPTWQVRRDNNTDRLKVIWRIPEDTRDHLPNGTPKIVTKRPSKPGAGDGENVAYYYGSGQVVVLGQHLGSGGNYFWPEGHGPVDVADIPPSWWRMAWEVAERGASKGKTSSKPNAVEGGWRRLNPCPICGRRERLLCAQNKAGNFLVCYHGGTFSPPEMRPGQVVTGSDGVRWAHTGIRAHGDIGDFSHFVVDEPRPPEPDPGEGFEVIADGYDQARDGRQQQDHHPDRHPGRSERQQQKSKPQEAKQPNKARKLSHSRAMRCFDRCVEVQAKQQRNSLTRRARLLKALHDLGLARYVNRAEISQKVLEAKDRQQGRCFQPISAAERIAMERPTVSWVIPGILPDGDGSIIGGRAKVGKTRFAYALAAAALTGKPVFGFEAPAPRPVIVISDDQGDGDTADMLHELGIWDHPHLIWSRHFRLTESDLDRALLTIKENPGALLIFDSLRSISRSLQEGENDPEIGAIIYDLKEAVVEAGGAPVLIHHCNKADGQIGMEALSGHNAIAGAANTILTITYLPDEKGRPQKDNPQRRFHREARSGKAFDLVIAPAAGGTFERVADFGEWDADRKKTSSEQETLGKMPDANMHILRVLCTDRDRWFTRREVCEARGVDWGDRGRSPEAQKVARALKRLVDLNFAESKRDGQEASFKAAGGSGVNALDEQENLTWNTTDESVMTAMPSNDTTRSGDITDLMPVMPSPVPAHTPRTDGITGITPRIAETPDPDRMASVSSPICETRPPGTSRQSLKGLWADPWSTHKSVA